ncbi:MAG: ABC transporter ATP-binding protein [Thermoplasmatota archaeon]
MPPLLELEGVTKLYGAHQALGPITVTVPETSMGLLGPNGAGKSTMIRILLGLLKPTTGTVRIRGEEVSPATKAVRRRIGYVPEGESLFPALSGVESVAYAGRLVGMDGTEALKRAHQVLDYVRLGEERYRLVENYSTGMKQRLKLAQAIVHDPPFLILDEPTEGVDPEARLHLLDLISELEKEHGLRILLSTHILPDVERLATHALVLNQGRMVAYGTIEELKKAESKAWIVRVNGPPEKLGAALDRHGIRWEAHAPDIRVETEDPRYVLKLVAEAGLVVRHLAPLTLTLEEAFEQAVGRPIEPAAPEAAAVGGGAF